MNSGQGEVLTTVHIKISVDGCDTVGVAGRRRGVGATDYLHLLTSPFAIKDGRSKFFQYDGTHVRN
jgi:hypothetical protein